MRSRRLSRCATCGLPSCFCVCATVPTLNASTRVVVIGHRAELFKSTNSGKLAAHLLANASVRTHGESPAQPELETKGAFVLFPSADALSLQQAVDEGIRTLLVPDGTWTQAKRIVRRDPTCARARCVRLEGTGESRYRLRRNARPEGLCTFEAIAEALRVIEGEHIADALLQVFELWTERALRVRAGDHHETSGVEDEPSTDETKR